mmetsp:Transcript_25906/g.34680  ORF Transcript_25906/g.34680 Transcript_25906/m.34680 type:complete len:128 (-) Transcript_25906:37-420(-)
MLVSVPFMISGGYLLQQKIGNKEALTFWQVSLLACFLSLWAFGPHTPCFDWHLRSYFPFRCDGIVESKQGLLAPDLMAACCLYILLWKYGCRVLVCLWFIMDACYYGPLALAMPFSVIWYLKVAAKK